MEHVGRIPSCPIHYYSGTVTKGDHHYFGWILDKKLYAVADYGSPTNKYQAHGLASQMLLNITNSNLVELKRLCRSEPKHRVQLTQFLGRCHRILRRMGIVYIVSFSDPAKHDGGIYRAANFEHIGQTDPGLACIGKDGVLRHRKYPYRYAANNGCTLEEAYTILGLTLTRIEPKDRWLLCIAKKKRKWAL